MPPNQPNGFSEIRIHRCNFGPRLPENGERLKDRVEFTQQQRGQFSYLLDTSPLEALNGVEDTSNLFKAPEPATDPIERYAELSAEDMAFMESLNSASSKVRSAFEAFFS